MDSTTKRLAYIDAMRGFTMFFVIFWHVLFMTFDLTQFDTPIGFVFRTFRLPLFFFVSGFVAYKPLSTWTISFVSGKLLSKARIQLIPTILFFALYHILHGRNPVTKFMTDGIMGYWFTVTLFCMFIIYYFVNLMLRKTDSQKLCFAVLVVISALLYLCNPIISSTEFYKILNLGGFFSLFQFFVLGLLVKAYYPFFKEILSKDWMKTLLLVAFILLCIIVWKGSTGPAKSGLDLIVLQFLSGFAVRYAGLLLVFSIFLSLESYFEAGGKLSKSMQFVGRRTLDIYLIHYIIMPIGLSKWYEPIADNSCVVLQFALVSFITVLVLLGSLAISALLRHSHFLGRILFGAK